MRRTTIAMLFFCALPFWGQSLLSPNAPQDRPVALRSADARAKLLKAIEPFVKAAKASWPSAKTRFLNGLPPGQVFSVTTELFDMSGHNEIVFVSVNAINNGTISGTIANDINAVIGFQNGQKFTLSEASILDWTISMPDGSEEGNLVGKFLDTYNP